ncbi:MerR family transcriptional regulator [Conexibacter sp. DBS9H8]|uniref:MerR family transcriptional regulator n=1 Tax=Conexibacter sp. DBS9H8 TaxID=2937801 RepID=UPI00200E430E|nr:MerR family transcriptional regulator [Conexibacter sp. DBS9H8]
MEPLFHIGELARRTGLSPAVIRAWERRYGVVSPQRSPGGTRLYSLEDLRRIERVQAQIATGLSAGRAAAIMLVGEPGSAEVSVDGRGPADVGDGRGPADVGDGGLGSGAEPKAADTGGGSTVPSPLRDGSEIADGAAELVRAFGRLDPAAAERALERLCAGFSLETLVRGVFLPYLEDVGRRWERGETSVAEEHLATHLLRGRLLAFSRGLTSDQRGRAVLACPPGEHHDITLTIFSVLLQRRGWAVTLLGADTPLDSVAGAAGTVGADLVVLAAMTPERFDDLTDSEVRALAGRHRLLITGPGADAVLAARWGAACLGGDPVAAADWLSREEDGR